METAKIEPMRMMSFRADKILSARVSAYAKKNSLDRSEAIRVLIEKGLGGANG